MTVSEKNIHNNMKLKRALLVGATGLIGSQLLPLLLDDPVYREVRVLTRRSLGVKHSKLREAIVDFDKLPQLSQAFFAVEDVFCCLGTTIKKAGSKQQFRKIDKDYPLTVAHKAKMAGASQFLLVSALGADTKSPFFYNQVKGELESELMQADFASLYIFRPSLLLGKRTELRLGEYVGGMLSKVFAPLFIGPLRRVQPIAAWKVAAAMKLAANYNRTGIHIYESQQIAAMINYPGVYP